MKEREKNDRKIPTIVGKYNKKKEYYVIVHGILYHINMSKYSTLRQVYHLFLRI